MKRFNKEKEVIILYNKGVNIKEIANTFSINVGTIYNIIHRNGIKPRRHLIIDEQTLINEYVIFNNITKLEKKYKISFKRIKEILLKNKIDTTLNFRTYVVNEEYFKTINSFDKAYFLGLLYADGYVNSEGFYLSLCEKDLETLESFKKYINYSGDIKTKIYTNENHCTQKQLNIYSKNLYKDLSLLGCTQNKSHSTEYPLFLNDEYHSHFIRGYFDGDGCVSIGKKSNRLTFSITGNYNLLFEIVNKLIINADVSKRNFYRCKRCKGNIVSFNYASSKDLLLIYNYLYKNSDSIRMNRKYITFKNYLNEKGLL